MIPKYNIDYYRKMIQKNTGKKIYLCIKKGRKMFTLKNCIIENAYQSLFIVKIYGENLLRMNTVSVCYADLLTGCARVTLINDAQEA
ncbi:MAG: Veg family protein [Clostridia bacterium]|nr:Veg family protein [Clostridia bacterium]